MKSEQAKQLLDKKWRIGLANGFIFTGEVIEIDGDSIVLIDKYDERVTIRISDISTYTEVKKDA